MKKLTSKHGSKVRKPAPLRVIFLSHTISPELYFFSINNPFQEFVDHMFENFFGNKLSMNQRSADNARRETVELCPASHRPLLTKVVHI